MGGEQPHKTTTMQAIKTKFFGPTNRRGSRVRAKCERGSLVVEWDHSVGPEENHRRAVRLLLDKFAAEDAAKYGAPPSDHHWGEFVSGSLSECMVHVLIRRWDGWGMLRRAAEDLMPVSASIADGKRCGATMGRLSVGLGEIRYALEEIRREGGAK